MMEAEAVIQPHRKPGAMMFDVESRRRTRPDVSRDRYDGTSDCRKELWLDVAVVQGGFGCSSMNWRK